MGYWIVRRFVDRRVHWRCKRRVVSYHSCRCHLLSSYLHLLLIYLPAAADGFAGFPRGRKTVGTPPLYYATNSESNPDYSKMMPWNQTQSKILRYAIPQHSVASGDSTVVLWNRLGREIPELRDYPVTMLVDRYRKEFPADHRKEPSRLWILPLLDQFSFTPTKNKIQGIVTWSNGTEQEIVTDTLHNNAMDTLSLGYIGCTSTKGCITFYEVGEPSSSLLSASMKTERTYFSWVKTCLSWMGKIGERFLFRTVRPHRNMELSRAHPIATKTSSGSQLQDIEGQVVDAFEDPWSRTATTTLRFKDYSSLGRRTSSSSFQLLGFTWQVHLHKSRTTYRHRDKLKISCLSGELPQAVKVRVTVDCKTSLHRDFLVDRFVRGPYVATSKMNARRSSFFLKLASTNDRFRSISEEGDMLVELTLSVKHKWI